MLFNAPVLAATAALILGAAAAPGPDDVFTALLRRQEPGTPAYDCHSNCGGAITLSKGASPCENQDFLDKYALCLACSGPDDVNIWRYYGTTLGAAGTKCGLSTTPGAAAPVETTTAEPVVETTSAAPVETSAPADTTSAGPVETSAPAETTTVSAVSSSEISSAVSIPTTPAISSAPALTSESVAEEVTTVTVTSCESSSTVAVVVPVGSGSAVVPSSNGTVTSAVPTASFTGAAAVNGGVGGAFAAVLAVAALAL